MRNGTARKQATWLLNEFSVNVVDRKLLGQNVIGAKESFVVRNIALERRGKRKGVSKRDKCQVFRRRVATTATASFASAEKLNCTAVKKQLLQSRISIVANVCKICMDLMKQGSTCCLLKAFSPIITFQQRRHFFFLYGKILV